MKKVRYIFFKFVFLLSPLLFSSLNPDLPKEKRERIAEKNAINSNLDYLI